jgi:hypothetical protein
MPFQPGNKHGVHKGRPSVGAALATAIREKWPPTRIMTLCERLAASEDDRAVMQLVQWLSDRGYGKVPDVIEAKEPISDDEAERILSELVKERLAKATPDELRALLGQAGVSEH